MNEFVSLLLFSDSVICRAPPPISERPWIFLNCDPVIKRYLTSAMTKPEALFSDDLVAPSESYKVDSDMVTFSMSYRYKKFDSRVIVNFVYVICIDSRVL